MLEEKKGERDWQFTLYNIKIGNNNIVKAVQEYIYCRLLYDIRFRWFSNSRRHLNNRLRRTTILLYLSCVISCMRYAIGKYRINCCRFVYDKCIILLLFHIIIKYNIILYQKPGSPGAFLAAEKKKRATRWAPQQSFISSCTSIIPIVFVRRIISYNISYIIVISNNTIYYTVQWTV